MYECGRGERGMKGYKYIRYVVPAYPHGKNACVYVCYNLLWSNFNHWATTSFIYSVLWWYVVGEIITTEIRVLVSN